MITKEQAKERLFEIELHFVKSFNPSVDITAFRTHWGKGITDKMIDKAWNIMLEMEAANLEDAECNPALFPGITAEELKLYEAAE